MARAPPTPILGASTAAALVASLTALSLILLSEASTEIHQGPQAISMAPAAAKTSPATASLATIPHGCRDNLSNAVGTTAPSEEPADGAGDRVPQDVWPSESSAASLLLVLGVAAAATCAAVSSAVALACRSGPGPARGAFTATKDYYAALWYFIVRGGSFEDCPYFPHSLHARCHVYSLACVFELWDKPHYRNGTFQEDMIKNLRNVAVPGTGLPLSVFAACKPLSCGLLLFGYPVVALVAAINAGRCGGSSVSEAFVEQLTAPQDWFSFWRLNCRLATLHSYVTKESDYRLEDKWEFLTTAEEKGVAVSPFLKMPGLVCKHRNEEGGLGFQSFKNAAAGGDWIIQRSLENGPFLASMLPENAPLSTFRIISASRGGLKSGTDEPVVLEDITALSCVWRAGRQGATTDHSAILFNVDPKSGVIGKGTTNTHWYQRGLSKVLTCPWTSTHNESCHPDNGAQISGAQVPQMDEMMAFVCDAHLKLIPHVPLAGWDVALTKDDGMLLLEANLSCNFFRGDFDQPKYFAFLSDYFIDLEHRSRQAKQAAADCNSQR